MVGDGAAARTVRPSRLPTSVSTAAIDDLAVLRDVLDGGLVRTVFQPIVDLGTRETVGYEALSRGPAGSRLERPDLLFAAARRYGLLRELDSLCRSTALRAARASGIGRYPLFVNCEPEALAAWQPSDTDGLDDCRLVVEVTERALLDRPAELLRTIAHAREMGWRIALDDVGADPASLALMPLIRPDVIKLDLRLVQSHASAEIALIANAVSAEAERSGAVVLAEGLETERHARVARSLGATLGQGWLLGRPAALPAGLGSRRPPELGLPVRGPDEDMGTLSPFAVAATRRPVRGADKQLLIEVSKQLEEHAARAGESALIVSAFQDASFFTRATRRRYERLVGCCSFVGALGVGIPVDPLPGVRGASLAAADPVREEWDVAVLGPHFSAVLVARDRGDRGADLDRRFEFVLSHDRDLTVQVAQALLARIQLQEPSSR